MSHWSSGLTCLLPATRVTGSNPLGGYFSETGILLLVMSCYSMSIFVTNKEIYLASRQAGNVTELRFTTIQHVFELTEAKPGLKRGWGVGLVWFGG
jgi:hypothetical protein